MTYEHFGSWAEGPFVRYFPQAGELFSKLAAEEPIDKNKIEPEYHECVLKEDERRLPKSRFLPSAKMTVKR